MLQEGGRTSFKNLVFKFEMPSRHQNGDVKQNQMYVFGGQGKLQTGELSFQLLAQRKHRLSKISQVQIYKRKQE